ncbi:MAG: CHRD domain-containing protein [Casimicrobiaceae bacterium]
MKTTMRSGRSAVLALATGLAVLAGCQSMGMMATQQVTLSGATEVPPVTTSATGNATVTIKEDRSVSAAVTVSGMTATASHIHEGAAGANGPVIVPFTKTGDNTFAAAPDAKLTEAQYASFKAGKLYVNVHSAKHPGGEIRAQLK